MKKFLTISVALILHFSLYPQRKIDGDKEKKSSSFNGYIVKAKLVGDDTVPMVNLYEVRIYEKRTFNSKREAQKYDKLKRDVKKAYPYAVMASVKLKEYNVTLAKMNSEVERNLYMKKAEKELIKKFEKDMRKLTVNQGRILIKLIDRETGTSSYNLVKELRGSFSAWMWQSLAVVFGTSLKDKYDSKGDDRNIENIICLIQSGEI